MATTKRSGARKTGAAKKGGARKTASKRVAKGARGGSSSQLKDPKGGLTAAGRARFRKTEGANLKPGVRGAADTPEKMRRKGSFLRRHFANPRGPMVDEDGQPTRLALSAHAWGEPVPKTAAAARKLAEKGAQLLERYQAAQGGATKGARKAARKGARKAARKGATAKRAGAKRATAKRATAKHATAKRTAKRASKQTNA